VKRLLQAAAMLGPWRKLAVAVMLVLVAGTWLAACLVVASLLAP
jgi:hypothetical protein